MFIIKKINAEKTYPLRINVLRNGIALNFHFVGDQRKSTFHLGAFKDEECIGIVTFILKFHPLLLSSSAYQLRGMAVSHPFQKQGIGRLLIYESYQYLKEKNCEIVWCNSRETAIEFYTKMGFSIKGNKFQIPAIGTHYMMWKKV